LRSADPSARGRKEEKGEEGRWYLRVLDRKKLLGNADLVKVDGRDGKEAGGGSGVEGRRGGQEGGGRGEKIRISPWRREGKERTLAKPAAHTNRATAA